MNKFHFIQEYIQSLPSLKQVEYRLNRGISEEEIRLLQRDAGFEIPDELREFYQFSYGALLDEYKILDIPEISQFMARIKTVYGDVYNSNIIPFAYLRGVGDLISFNTNGSNEDGLLIIDCFHELPPNEWKEIGFGLKNWLMEMVNNDFRPFWI